MQRGYRCVISNILAHRIRISEILPWDRKSYLTQAILPRLSREGYIHWLYWNSGTWSSSDVIIMFNRPHHVQLHLSLFRDYWKLILKLKKVVSKKNNYYLCEGRIEKSAPQDHHLSLLPSLVMPYGDPRDEFYYPTLTLMIDSYIISWVCPFVLFSVIHQAVIHVKDTSQ